MKAQMLSWFLIMKLLHILSAMLLAGGQLGRGLAFAGARRVSDVTVTYALLHQSERFEKLMIRPGSEIVFVFGLLTAWLAREPLFGIFTGAGPNWLSTALVLYLLTIPLVIIILAPATRRRRMAAETALAAGCITPELRAALTDRTVLITRNVELVIIFVVVSLMVLKPF
jgi:uncharacterized membrane protein